MKNYKQSKVCGLGKCSVTVTFENRFTPEVLEQIRETIGSRHAETGGMLGTTDGGRTIDHFYFDRSASVSGVTYSPDTDTLNDVIAKWNEQGIKFCGFIHSHPLGSKAPSLGDYIYAKRILSCMELPNDTMMMPIVQVFCPKKRCIAIEYYEYRPEHTHVTESESAVESPTAEPVSSETEKPADPDCNIPQATTVSVNQTESNRKDDWNEENI